MNCETRISTVPPPTQLKDVFVSTIASALSALEALCDYALYKSTFYIYITFTLQRVFREYLFSLLILSS